MTSFFFFHISKHHLHATSQRHDMTSILIAIQCDLLCANCRLLKTGLVDHIGVPQTPNMFTFSLHRYNLTKGADLLKCIELSICQTILPEKYDVHETMLVTNYEYSIDSLWATCFYHPSLGNSNFHKFTNARKANSDCQE